MKRFLKNNGIWLLAAAAIIAVVLCILSSLSSGAGFLTNALGVIASPFRAAGTAVTTWVQDMGDRFDSVEALQAENDALRSEIADLEEQLRRSESATEENERLRSLLDLRQQRRDFSFESALITERPTSNWSRVYVLGKGSNFGIDEGDCVVDAQGYLVGVISEAGYNWSRMTSLLDTDCQIGASVFRTDDLGIAQGDLALMVQNRLKLGYLANDVRLLQGDLITTSGLGGYYPSGIVIGTVDQVLTDDSGMTQYATLIPKTDLDTLSQVFVITDFDVVE